MATNYFVNEKKKALLAYKEKLLDEIKCYEKNIDEFHTNHKNIKIYDHNVDSSDSEDDIPQVNVIDSDIMKLKLKQAMLKTCLHATQELTDLTVLQSEVNVMVEQPTFEGEPPVTEDGTWQEVTAECRIHLVPFTIHFFMHTPTRKFASPSYRGLRVVPVKSAQELELAKSVLHTMKVPSDAIEVLRNYAVGYRSRRSTLTRLGNKYANTLFMELHAEGGFLLKCADLLELSWSLQNKWSPVAPFHHKMKFDLEYMDESYIKEITQTHKQLINPAIDTDDRTLLLAKIIQTCLEARSINPESDLEERDVDIEKRDSETEKRDSEVMAPPKSLPKKPKNKSSLPNLGQKRRIHEESDNAAKKMRNSDLPSAGLRNVDDSNGKVDEIAKKRKIFETETENKVADNNNVKDTGNIENETENVKDKVDNTKKRKINDVETKKKVATNKNKKDAGNTENETGNNATETFKDINNKPANSKNKNDKETLKTKTKSVKETQNIENVNANTKPDNIKESGNQNKNPVNTKTKNVKETGDGDKNTKTKTKNVKEMANIDGNSGTKIKNKEPNDTEKTKTAKETVAKDKNNKETNANIKSKTKIIKEPSKISSEPIKETNSKEDNPKNIEKKIPKKVASKENVDANDTEKVSTKKTEGTNKVVGKSTNVAKTKNTELIPNKIKPTTTKSKESNIGKINQGVVKPTEKKSKEKLAMNTAKNLKEKPILNSNIVKKVTEKHATNKIKDKISPIINKATDTQNKKEITPNVVSKNINNKSNNITNKKTIKEPIKKMSLQIASHRTALKVQNPPKSIKSANTKIFSAGNTEKENGGKVSRIPQKKFSPILSEGSSKKNFLRISPRKLLTKVKTSDTIKPVIVKSTNIPRLLKKPAPKTTH